MGAIFRSHRVNVDSADDFDEDEDDSEIAQKPNQYLRSQEKSDDSKKQRRSHLGSSEGDSDSAVSVYVSNELEHCDENQRRCADCFGIEKKNNFQTVDRDLVLSVQRQ